MVQKYILFNHKQIICLAPGSGSSLLTVVAGRIEHLNYYGDCNENGYFEVFLLFDILEKNVQKLKGNELYKSILSNNLKTIIRENAGVKFS